MDNAAPDFQWDTLFQNPDLYLLEFIDQQALFVQMSRETYGRSIFTDRQRIQPAQRAACGLNTEAILGRADAEAVQRPLQFIFHLAHGGSTLLARALDRPGRSLVIREPFPLRQLAVEHMSANPAQFNRAHWQRRLQLVTGLLGRRYQELEPVLVKANVPVNFILPELLSLHPDSRGILLYSSLKQYLISVLKSPDHHRWVTNVTRQLAGGIRQVQVMSEVVVDRLSPAQAAACLWLAQMSKYIEALESNPGLRTLNSDIFFERPGETLLAASDHMGLGFSSDEIQEIVTGDLFTTHAKVPGMAYDNSARKADLERLALENQDDISEGLKWAEQYMSDSVLLESLPRPLVS